MDFKEFCHKEYLRIYSEGYSNFKSKKSEDKRRYAQKKAIKDTSVNAMKKYPNVEPTNIWNTIYISHVNNVSGVVDQETIKNVISADNSWKKSSGHAFEEMVKEIGNIHLSAHNINILLQKELNIELKEGNILNEVRDISWLKEQITTSIFDLYLTIVKNNKYLVYGCIQTKTSIRDRVTRDREPSINAMSAFFVSIAIVMNGSFLKLPKFQNMVNGNSTEFKLNGWHSMYVLTNEAIENDRIKSIDINMKLLVEDCIKGAKFWTEQRQWLRNEWRPS